VKSNSRAFKDKIVVSEKNIPTMHQTSKSVSVFAASAKKLLQGVASSKIQVSLSEL
jgi:hypothetical protein